MGVFKSFLIGLDGWFGNKITKVFPDSLPEKWGGDT
jgi:hypothetical protein